ncbi:MAG: macro domain-containing protein [Chloroflexi bacterium]|nr:macro domain-containing protein [Chloroflexota bacterium]MDL1943176.1 macro domain-containing protein [Chloroflexi bacterium CFX2]
MLVEKKFPSGQTLQIVQGDITSEEVDAIVNAANERLAHGGGVAWAISKKGGAAIQRESDDWVRRHGPVSHAHPAWTSGGLLPAKYVIHAVGPVWGDTLDAGAGGDEDKKLSDAVTGSLHVADELKCKAISMPAISTGIFGFPKDRAAGIIFQAIASYFEKNKNTSVKQVRIVLFDKAAIEAFLAIWKTTFQ